MNSISSIKFTAYLDNLPDIQIRCAAFLWPLMIAINCVGIMVDRHLNIAVKGIISAVYY